jgi:hypothetical protein
MDPKLTREQTERIARLMERYEIGERVRAVETISYAASGGEVAEGSLGHVQRTKIGGCDPLVSVAWAAGGVEITSVESLEPVDRPPRHSLEDLLDQAGRGKRAAPALPLLEIEVEREPFERGGELDLRALREDLRKVSIAWLACVDDLVAVGVLRTGHVPPNGVARLGETIGAVDRAGELLDVLIRALEPNG